MTLIINPVIILAHLAVISSDEELSLLQAVRANHEVQNTWVGFHDQFGEGDWVSVLDEPVGSPGTYVRWAPRTPNLSDNCGENQNCARITDGGVAEAECSKTYTFFCKIILDGQDCRLGMI